jgi:CDP-6-deoxy-D-xylo-4-hexulose-3-dehydrase
MSTIEGGMVCFNNPSAIVPACLMMRSHGWMRDLDEMTRRDLKEHFDIGDFEESFTFIVGGFNVRSTDFNAYLGLSQLDSLDDKVMARHKVWNILADDLRDHVQVQVEPDGSFVSPLGFGFLSERRTEIANALMAAGVECRPLICGNIARHPFWVKEQPNLPVADRIHEHGMYIPCHDRLTTFDVNLMIDIVREATK